MRRWVERILACLALGLFTTVAVAWSAALWSGTRSTRTAEASIGFAPLSRPELVFAPGESGLWARPLTERAIREGWVSFRLDLALLVHAYINHSAGRGFERCTWTLDRSDPQRHIIRAGFPLYALTCEASQSGTGGLAGGLYPFAARPAPSTPAFPIGNSPDWTDALPSPDQLHPITDINGHPRPLPVRPIPRGLIFDSLLFALAWSALLFAPRAIRTRLRLRRGRGLCPACGYDLAGNTTGICPECGRAKPS